MLKYSSQYEGEDFDETIKWVKSQKEFATSKIVESSPEIKIDLDTLTTEQGTFTIYYYTNSYNDSSVDPINLDVIFLNDGSILQRYEYLENYVQRIKQNEEWTPWMFVKNFIIADENDNVSVNTDTLVLRSIETPVSEFFKDDEPEPPETNPLG